MARKTHLKKSSPTGLLSLANEILLDIVSFLCTSDLRRLSIVNRRLYFFIEDYLCRYRYSSGLLALPNEIILEIVQYLGRQKDRSHLARASLRFYPLVMEYVYCHNVRYGESSLLNYAAKQGLNRMARAILRLGGDIDAHHYELQSTITQKRITPLTIAAFYGHEPIVKMLLENGASHFVDGVRVALAAAISKRHESVALLLSHQLDFEDISLEKIGSTPLQMACMKKLPNLVRHYLERGSQREGSRSLQDCSIALHCILQEDATRYDFTLRKIHEDAYQVVLMLLHNGANPDTHMQIGVSKPVSTRILASRYPDPRVRALLSTSTSANRSKCSNLTIGRPWMPSFKNEPLQYFEPRPEAFFKISHSATLSDFLEGRSYERWIQTIEDEADYQGQTHDDRKLNASDVTFLMKSRMRGLVKRPKTMEPLPLSSFPQLGMPKAGAQDAAQEFWANKPIRAFSNVSSTQTPRTSSMKSVPQNTKRVKNSAARESFPQLSRPGPASNDTGKDLWARFSKERTSQPTAETKQVFPHKEGDGPKRKVQKPSKKKKWQPLLI